MPLPVYWPLVFLPYLVQTHLLHPYYRTHHDLQSRFIRLALLPISLYLAFTIPFLPSSHFPGHLLLLNFPEYMLLSFLILKTVEVALTRGEDFYRIEGRTEDEKEAGRERQRKEHSFVERWKWTWCCVISPRGVGFGWNPDLRRQTPEPSTTFLRTLLMSQVLLLSIGMLLLAMFSISVHTQDLPPSASHTNPLLNFLISNPSLLSLIHSKFFLSPMIGIVVYVGLAFNYNGCALLHYLLQTHLPFLPPFDPSLWPPLFNFFTLSGKLHNIDSLRNFWSVGWHSMFKRTFFFFGVKPYLVLPLPRVMKKILSVLTVFAISGLIHELGLRMALSLDHPEELKLGRNLLGWLRTKTFWFFELQGVGIIVESALRLRGTLGMLFTIFWLTATATLVVDDWLGRLHYKEIMPPAWEWKDFVLDYLHAFST
ncbi:hypothetical protein BT69DRAFT_1350699 [Atractiella rhizophila]|nr:hypothetical protein BT69DRAFT_1350699 [Atractiella rhizophila]